MLKKCMLHSPELQTCTVKQKMFLAGTNVVYLKNDFKDYIILNLSEHCDRLATCLQ